MHETFDVEKQLAGVNDILHNNMIETHQLYGRFVPYLFGLKKIAIRSYEPNFVTTLQRKTKTTSNDVWSH